jgi:hypothetical protein
VEEACVVILKNRQNETMQGAVPARSKPGKKSSWQLEKKRVVNLKNHPDAVRGGNAPARSTPGGNSSWHLEVQAPNSSWHLEHPEKKSSCHNRKNQDDNNKGVRRISR